MARVTPVTEKTNTQNIQKSRDTCSFPFALFVKSGLTSCVPNIVLPLLAIRINHEAGDQQQQQCQEGRRVSSLRLFSSKRCLSASTRYLAASPSQMPQKSLSALTHWANDLGLLTRLIAFFTLASIDLMRRFNDWNEPRI